MRRRILLITPFAPSGEARHGSARAIHGLLGVLVQRHEVVVLHTDRDDAFDPQLARQCAAIHVLPSAPLGQWSRRALGVRALLQGRSMWASELGIGRLQTRVELLTREWRPHVVQVEHGVLGEALARTPAALRVVTIRDPAVSLREFLPFRHVGLPLAHRLDAACALREERRTLALADAAVVFTASDRQRLATPHSALAPGHVAELVTIPHGSDVPPAPLDPVGGDPPTVLFVGSFMHPPNLDAALRLAQSIFPRVRRDHPQAILEIVGSSPPPELLSLASESIHVTGAVPSVVPYLDRAAVVVAPIALGGGVRVKVLEALAAGKAVVASSRGADGITARRDEHLLIADGDDPTAAAVGRLLADPDARRDLAERARAWAISSLTWSAMADRYDELYNRLEQQRSPRMSRSG